MNVTQQINYLQVVNGMKCKVMNLEKNKPTQHKISRTVASFFRQRQIPKPRTDAANRHTHTHTHIIYIYIYIYIVIHRQICSVLSELISVARHTSFPSAGIESRLIQTPFRYSTSHPRGTSSSEVNFKRL